MTNRLNLDIQSKNHKLRITLLKVGADIGSIKRGVFRTGSLVIGISTLGDAIPTPVELEDLLVTLTVNGFNGWIPESKPYPIEFDEINLDYETDEYLENRLDLCVATLTYRSMYQHPESPYKLVESNDG